MIGYWFCLWVFKISTGKVKDEDWIIGIISWFVLIPIIRSVRGGQKQDQKQETGGYYCKKELLTDKGICQDQCTDCKGTQSELKQKLDEDSSK